jgi:hypothetical protein
VQLFLSSLTVLEVIIISNKLPSQIVISYHIGIEPVYYQRDPGVWRVKPLRAHCSGHLKYPTAVLYF